MKGDEMKTEEEAPTVCTGCLLIQKTKVCITLTAHGQKQAQARGTCNMKNNGNIFNTAHCGNSK